MPSPPDYFRVLLIKAGQDLAAARRLLGDDEIADEVIGFHCQQTVEKALKAVLEQRLNDYPFTHDLLMLLGLFEPSELVPLSNDDGLLLNQFAVRFRYDLLTVMPSNKRLDRTGAVTLAAEVLNWARLQTGG